MSIVNSLSMTYLYSQLTNSNSLKIYLWTSVCLFLAYAAEIGQFSFSSDYYFGLLNSQPPTSYSADGRFLAEFIRFYILDGVLPPAMLLIIGVCMLAVTGNIIAITWGCGGAGVRVLAGLLLAIFPFFYANFSYINMRHIVPLSILLSVLGVVTGGFHTGYSDKLKGFLFLYSSLFLYQASINCAAVLVFMWSALLIYETKEPREVIEKVILPKLAMIFVSILAYKLTLYFTDFIGVTDTGRFGSFSVYPQGLSEVLYTISAHLNAMMEYFYKGSFLFPIKAKLITSSMLVLFLVSVLLRAVNTNKYFNYLFILFLILCAVVATHGLVIPFYPPEKFLTSRILVAYSVFGVCIFLVSTKIYGRTLSKIVVTMGGVLVVFYIVQANMWHQYLLMKNQADIDMTQQITHRLKNDPAYKENLPLAIIGTLHSGEYRYHNVFEHPTSLIGSSIAGSVYSQDWSKDRLIRFYMAFIDPDTKQLEKAQKYSVTHNSWPNPESVAIKDGVMIIVLNKI